MQIGLILAALATWFPLSASSNQAFVGAVEARIQDAAPEVVPVVPERLICSMPEEGKLLKMSVPAVAWSPDGTRAAFVMMMMGKKKNRVVLFSTSVDRRGKVKMEDHGEFALGTIPVFSDDGSSFACVFGDDIGEKSEAWRLIVDGKTYRKDDWIGTPSFWPGTTDLIFWTQPDVRLDGMNYYGGDYVLRINKKPGDEWMSAEAYRPMAFSRDGSVAASLVSTIKGAGVLHITPKKQTFESVQAYLPRKLVLNHDGSVVAFEEFRLERGANDLSDPPVERYSIRKGDKRYGAGHHSAEMPEFAPTGDGIAFKVAKRDKWALAIEGVDTTHFDWDDIVEIAWESGTPGAESLAFIGRINDSTESPPEGDPTWKPKFTDVVKCVNNQGVELEGGTQWDEVRGLVLAPGGASTRNLAYAARRGTEWFLVHESLLDGTTTIKQSLAFDYVGKPVLTEAGWAAGAIRAREIYWITI